MADMIIQRIVRPGPGPNDVRLVTIPPEEYYLTQDGSKVKVWLRDQSDWGLGAIIATE